MASPAPTDPPRDPEAAERARMVERRAMLAELAEIGMELARAIGRQALAATEDGDAPAGARPAAADLGLSFSRVARAVRQTLALEARLAVPAPKPAAAAGSIIPDDIARLALEGGAGARTLINQHVVLDVVERMIEDEAGDEEAAERLFDDLMEKLHDEDYDIGERAIGVTLARICGELGLQPDWSRWAGEDWAVEEAESCQRGSPFGRPARGSRVVVDDDDQETGGGKTGPPWH